MRIGVLARLLGLNPKTIRYYEAIGLLPPARRSPSGYRQYDDDTRLRLAFIARSKAIGLSLAEIKEILTLRDSGACPCGYVERLLDQKLQGIAERMRDLDAMQRELSILRGLGVSAAPNDNQVCGIIEHQPQAARPHTSARARHSVAEEFPETP